MRTLRGHPVRLLAALLLAASSALLGWAHRPVAATAPALAAYMLPGGIAPDLCLSADPDRRAPGGERLCDACLLACSILPPPQGAAVAAPRAPVLGAARPGSAAPAVAAAWRPAQARAPPARG